MDPADEIQTSPRLSRIKYGRRIVTVYEKQLWETTGPIRVSPLTAQFDLDRSIGKAVIDR